MCKRAGLGTSQSSRKVQGLDDVSGDGWYYRSGQTTSMFHEIFFCFFVDNRTLIREHLFLLVDFRVKVHLEGFLHPSRILRKDQFTFTI